MAMDRTASDNWQGASGGARAYLQQFLQENATSLEAIICGYVAKMSLATGENIEHVAAEVFQEAALEILAHADRFNLSMQPRAWFLGIAANILKRQRTTYARRYRFEVLIGNLTSKTEWGNEPDLLDRLMGYASLSSEPEYSLVAEEGARELLGLVSPEDAQLLNMALIQGWDAESLASMMSITSGTVRVRVHRALGRLRKAWKKANQKKEPGKHNG